MGAVGLWLKADIFWGRISMLWLTRAKSDRLGADLWPEDAGCAFVLTYTYHSSSGGRSKQINEPALDKHTRARTDTHTHKRETHACRDTCTNRSTHAHTHIHARTHARTHTIDCNQSLHLSLIFHRIQQKKSMKFTICYRNLQST